MNVLGVLFAVVKFTDFLFTGLIILFIFSSFNFLFFKFLLDILVEEKERTNGNPIFISSLETPGSSINEFFLSLSIISLLLKSFINVCVSIFAFISCRQGLFCWQPPRVIILFLNFKIIMNNYF